MVLSHTQKFQPLLEGAELTLQPLLFLELLHQEIKADNYCRRRDLYHPSDSISGYIFLLLIQKVCLSYYNKYP